MSKVDGGANGPRFSRRGLIAASAGGIAAALAGRWFWLEPFERGMRAEVFLARARDYSGDLAGTIKEGLAELGLGRADFLDRVVFLKPNLVEPRKGMEHANTHPVLVGAAVDAFRSLGARKVIVGEGTGHCRDGLLCFEVSGLQDVLRAYKTPYLDLNFAEWEQRPNVGGLTTLRSFALPRVLQQADWVVSMPKMKTHHWAGVTVSMKNLFGVLPGAVYGWPKNVLHWVGIPPAILDVNATVRAHLAIVDGILGMEGDGPLMGTPKAAGVLAFGRNLPAVDATCARVMGVDPFKIPYLRAASGFQGPIREPNIIQKGESIRSVQTRFALLEQAAAHRGIRLEGSL
jgi:uncharacterized protein (DUF362 family)